LYFSTSSIIKTIKSIKTILKKIITKKIMWGNIEAINDVLKKKTTKLNFQPAQYEKNKFNKDNLKKNYEKRHMGKHCSKAKIMWGNTIAIHSVLKSYKVKFSINSI
jgi:predicted Zn-ribbon and HTH transcriptional regulator